MSSIHRPAAMAAALAATGLLAACTPSVGASTGADPFAEPIVPTGAVDEVQSAMPGALGAPEPDRGSGTVKVAVLDGAQLPTEVVDAFYRATGFDLDQDAVSSASEISGVGADVALGLGAGDVLAAKDALAASAPFEVSAPEGTAIAGVDSEIAYGRDDVCVLADKAWMSANKRALPTSLGDLAKAENASLLSIPDPRSSRVGALFVEGAAERLGEGLGEWAKALKSGQALIADSATANSAWTALEAPQSGDSSAANRPLLVAPMSAISRTISEPGVEASAEALAGTCVQRVLYAAPAAGAKNEDGARALLAWLLSWEGQHDLASAGLVYPLDGTALEGTAAHWFLAPLADAQAISEDALAASAERIAMWEAGLQG